MSIGATDVASSLLAVSCSSSCLLIWSPGGSDHRTMYASECILKDLESWVITDTFYPIMVI